MKVTFNYNDNQALMYIDDVLINEEIPYVPEKSVDNRGLYLYLYAKNNLDRVEIKDFEFLTETPNINEIFRGFNYMKNPIFVKQAIKNFKNRI